MSAGYPSSYYRRRIGRAASPPLFQIYDLPISEPISRSPSPSDGSDSEDSDCSSATSSSSKHSSAPPSPTKAANDDEAAHDNDEEHCTIDDIGEKKLDKTSEAALEEAKEEKRRKREKRKGKQREDGGEDRKTKRKKRKDRDPVYAYRPIVTIRSSQGFVWNQDLFVPSYLKERYLTSLSPSTSTSGSPPPNYGNSFSGMDFEVECVEIRVNGDDSPLDGMIPVEG